MKLIPLASALALSAFLLTACSKNEGEAPAASEAPAAEVQAPAAEAAPAPAPEAAAPAVAANDAGKKVYGGTCAMCHASGLAGAPKPGDKEAWAARIAQGSDTLHKHAIEGFTGSNGMMPAKGGNASLSDDDVKAAVDYMVSQSQ